MSFLGKLDREKQARSCNVTIIRIMCCVFVLTSGILYKIAMAKADAICADIYVQNTTVIQYNLSAHADGTWSGPLGPPPSTLKPNQSIGFRSCSNGGTPSIRDRWMVEYRRGWHFDMVCAMGRC